MKNKTNLDEFTFQPKVNLAEVDLHDLKAELDKRQADATIVLEKQFQEVTEMLKNINRVKYDNSIVLNEDDTYIELFMSELKSLGVLQFNYWQSSSAYC